VKLYAAMGEQFGDLMFSYASDIRGQGIVHVKVIPNDKAVFSRHTKHFLGHQLFHSKIKNGADMKDRKNPGKPKCERTPLR